MSGRRWRRWAVVTAVVPAAVVAGGYGARTWADWRNRTAVRMGEPVAAERFTAPDARTWELVAQHQWMRMTKPHDHLCLDLVPPGFAPGAIGGCGFDPRMPMSDYWASRALDPATFAASPDRLAPDRSAPVYYWGPTPDNVVKVRLSGSGLPTYEVPTRPLPAGHGIAPGRYFLVDADPAGRISGYAVAAGKYWTVRWLDVAGRPVPFRPF